MLKLFKKRCQEFLQDRLYDSYLYRFAYGLDASCYRYIPKLVLKPKNEEEVQKIIILSDKLNIPLTFKGSGTSLCGQALSDSVLVLCVDNFKEIKANEHSIWCECGVIGSDANEALKPFGKKIGPDPATINNASIGGIFSNNSSGMCCGVKQNSYQTIKSVRIILNDGFILDTSKEESLKEFQSSHKNLANGLLALREELMQDPFLLKEIKRKFAIKNTTGYGLNSLCDFSDLRDILNHIFIGAEGTLGFVSRVEYETCEDYAFKATGLLFYENLNLASKAVKILSYYEDKVFAAELMDWACLDLTKGLCDMPSSLKSPNCALLIELQSDNEQELLNNIVFIKNALKDAPCLFEPDFSLDSTIQAKWWKIRKGLLPISASKRPKGSVVITEDVCFEMDYFTKGIENISTLFTKHGFEGIIFGHALSGNVHFIITPLLDDKRQRLSFEKFMQDLVDLVISLKGSIKAEHGTGRMMAAFVEQEWGEKAYKFHRKIKALFDPKGLINPGVIINDDKEIHSKNFKPSHQIEDYLEACMECGFCEKYCPSKNLTLTPRQRIAVHREIKRLKALKQKSEGEEFELSELQKGYEYGVVKTCASCSMCASFCPLEIDSAKIATAYNNQNAKGFFIANYLAKNLDKSVKMAKFGLNLAQFGQKTLGKQTLKKLSLGLNQKFHTPIVPIFMPNANHHALNSSPKSEKSVIYLSSCLNRAFAPSSLAKDKRALQEVFESLCKKADISVLYPENITRFCCGKAFKNYTLKTPELNPLKSFKDELLTLSENGKIPLVCDHSACSAELVSKLDKRLKIYDMSEFIEKEMLHKLNIKPLEEDLGLYVVCSAKKCGFDESLRKLARVCTKGKVYEHSQTHCCGFAGDKGFIKPELNANALKDLKNYFANLKITRFYSSSSTCEIGLSDTTRHFWQHLIYLLDELSD
ncbi:FAD-binding and (Fe-S)-binding domain-containing protein [Campylobacter upsaliensis]|uniref:FAD-binding and (Fe-S)-binding domain-containing protein n=1 Tax=Campylobacter upsaliensis TaxID=28080 RepID=UPI002B3B08B9|nr:FAD-binding and (Fe-S)-binding domain-containing protein [Campylobacter upsaliensis]MEB2832072.1 FAD-binding and (Fe-S)-binding domain-containing protein [Campylobacter upsaliensis]